jgi:hypothetical protein
VGVSGKGGNVMKRIAFCLISGVLLMCMYAQNSTAATATVTLSRMTQAYTGGPLKPTATTNPPNLPIVWTNAPKTAAGSYAVTATIGANSGNYTGSKSGTFAIYRPAGGFGGGTIGGGSEGWVFIFQGLWSYPDFPVPEQGGIWFDPTFLCRNDTPTVYLKGIIIIAPKASDPASVAAGTYELYSDPAQCSASCPDGPPLFFGARTPIDLTGNATGYFTWDDPKNATTWEDQGLNSCSSQCQSQAAFGLWIPGTGIPIYNVPGMDDLMIEFLFSVGGQDVSIIRTWDLTADSTPKSFLLVETTPIPPPPIPQPDDLTVLSASYTKVRQVPLLLGWWMYSYKLNVTSSGTVPLVNVCGKVKSSSSSVKVIDPEVCFPDISAGGSATSKGTFTFTAKSPDTSKLSWSYSSLKITADASAPIIEPGTHELSYFVTLSTSAPKNYYVLFHEWIPAGVNATPDAPLGWETSEAKTWTVTRNITVPAAMASEIKAGAWILNTFQWAEVTVPIEVP